MNSESKSDGSFDPIHAEFGDNNLQPLSETLYGIETKVGELLKAAHRHPVIEHRVLVEGNPVVIKKHLETSRLDEYGSGVDYPFGEIAFFDEFGRIKTQYNVKTDGSVCLQPGFITGYNWEMDSEGRIITEKNNWPRSLEPEEIDKLAEQVFGSLEVPVPDIYQGPLILWAIDMAATRGVRAYEMKELHLIEDPRSPNSNGNIFIDSVKREEVQISMGNAQKLKFAIRTFIEPHLREATTFTIRENGLAEYEFNYEDFRQVPDALTQRDSGKVREEPEDFVEQFNQRIARANEQTKWDQLAQETGLKYATQEQAERVDSLLSEIEPRVK